MIDYAACVLLRTIGPLIRFFPPPVAFWLGRRIGDIIYVFDVKHRTLAHANLKTALGDKLAPGRLSSLALAYYRNLGQNIIEVFMIPAIDGKYAKKYVSIEGLENLREAFNRGKGVLFVSVHEGSWELSNILAQHLKVPYSMFVREQKMPRLNALLNSYRSQKGCRIIRREDQTRELIRLIRANESCGLTIDQGGRDGIRVRFFNKDASMASGAVRLALKYDAALVPAFSTRVRGPYIKIIFEPAFRLTRTGDTEGDIKTNLQDLVWLFQKYVYRYPQDYFWNYRIWKYSLRRDVLILSDGKTGHLRQSQALARIIAGCLKNKGIDTKVHEVRVHIKNRMAAGIIGLGAGFTCQNFCQGCAGCLRSALTRDSYSAVTSIKCDMVISCGSSLAAVNRIIGLENQAKSVIIMKPGNMSLGLFDLAIIAGHDNPQRRRNVVRIEGALNLIDSRYLAAQGSRLQSHLAGQDLSRPVIGALFGGDAKQFRLAAPLASEVCSQLSLAAGALSGSLLVTTSRRTQLPAQEAVRQAFAADPRCKFLVIANEQNYDFSVGGILDRSDIVVISPESISMVSEAASADKYVVVFEAPGLSAKHLSLLSGFQKSGLIRLAAPQDLVGVITDIWRNRPVRRSLDNTAAVIEGLRKIL